MFQGVIIKSFPVHDFDGKISLKRVSKISRTKKVSFNQKFDDGYHVTHLLFIYGLHGGYSQISYFLTLLPQ
jgi:hypothetical protein